MEISQEDRRPDRARFKNVRQDEREPLTTALSTLTARVAVLERWMHRSQRWQTATGVILAIIALVCAVLLLR
jgi:hypothetical protein